jgi:hypothetical protein
MPATPICSTVVPAYATKEVHVGGKQGFGEEGGTVGEETVVKKRAFEDEVDESVKGVPDEEEPSFGIGGLGKSVNGCYVGCGQNGKCRQERQYSRLVDYQSCWDRR